MSGWFSAQIVHTGRLPLFCFFVAFLASFVFIRVSVRLIRAQVRWWPGNVTQGDTHLHHMVFGVVFMVIAGVAGIAAPAQSLGWRAGSAALFGIGTALVLDEFALILHLRDVYWTSAGRVSIDAVFVAAGITALLLVGVTPAGVQDVAGYLRVPGRGETLASLVATLALLFGFAAITLLKGKMWTGLFGLFLSVLFFVGALRLARPYSPWARWRYQGKPEKLARASRREKRVRQPVIRTRARLEDLVAGYHDRPLKRTGGAPGQDDKQLLCDQAGFRPTVVFEGDDLSSVRGFVAAGLGVAILPAPRAGSPESAEGPVLYCEIPDPGAVREICLTWSAERRLLPAAELFRQHVIRQAAAGRVPPISR